MQDLDVLGSTRPQAGQLSAQHEPFLPDRNFCGIPPPMLARIRLQDIIQWPQCRSAR
jgi:hypothetical protein